MSRRTFLRRFKASTGTTPGAWLRGRPRRAGARAAQVVAAAIEEVAAAAGFGSAATLRHHFRKQVKVSPAAYRRRFGMGGLEARPTQRLPAETAVALAFA